MTQDPPKSGSHNFNQGAKEFVPSKIEHKHNDRPAQYVQAGAIPASYAQGPMPGHFQGPMQQMPMMPNPGYGYQQPQMMYPQGQMMYPQGQMIYPQGQPMYPQGQPMYPQGQMGYPQAQLMYPQMGYPQGQMMYPQGYGYQQQQFVPQYGQQPIYDQVPQYGHQHPKPYYNSKPQHDSKRQDDPKSQDLSKSQGRPTFDRVEPSSVRGSHVREAKDEKESGSKEVVSQHDPKTQNLNDQARKNRSSTSFATAGQTRAEPIATNSNAVQSKCPTRGSGKTTNDNVSGGTQKSACGFGPPRDNSTNGSRQSNPK